MNKKSIRNQRVTATKVARAKELRRNLTQAEHLLWQALRRNQLDGFHFRRQQIIDGFIVDFYCHAVGLVIEVDGPIHQQQQVYDTERTHILQQRGLTILRFTNDQVLNHLLTCLEEIRHHCHHNQSTNASH